MAWAIQRRQQFDRPSGFIYAFVSLAQSLLDEYRCEAALTAGVTRTDTTMAVQPADWADIAAIFTTARTHHVNTGDLEGVFTQVGGGLDRVASFAGYAAATISRREHTRQDWSVVEPVILAADALLDVPGAETRMAPTAVLSVVERLVHSLWSDHREPRLPHRSERGLRSDGAVRAPRLVRAR